jgi:hypothetical protein
MFFFKVFSSHGWFTEVRGLSKVVEGLVGVFLDVFEKHGAIKETVVILRGDGDGLLEFVFGSIAHDFADR